MKIISLKICPFVQRVIAMLEAKKLSYEVEYIDFDQPPAWFLEVSPNQQVPILLTDSGEALFESEAIMEYLDDTSAPLEADITPEARALDRAWGYMASNLYMPQCSAMQSQTQADLTQRQLGLAKPLQKIDNQLSDLGFFKGTQLSNVDIAWLPILHRFALIEKHTGFDFLDGFGKVKRWQQALLKTGLAEKSVAQDFETIFTNFYLSERTYLGNGKDCDSNTPNACGGDNGTSCCG